MSTPTVARRSGSVQSCRRLWVARLEEIQSRAAWLTQAMHQAWRGLNEDVGNHGGKLGDAQMLDLGTGVMLAMAGLKREAYRLESELAPATAIIRREVMKVCAVPHKQTIAGRLGFPESQPEKMPSCHCKERGKLLAVK